MSDSIELARGRHGGGKPLIAVLAGLMQEHGVEPGEYLADVHDIDFSPLLPDPVLAARIAALPGRRSSGLSPRSAC